VPSNVISNIDVVGTIRDYYSVDKGTLGKISCSTVSRARKRSTKEEFAVKTITKAKGKNFDCTAREIAIMKMMDHKNIVKLVETFEDRRTIRLVMEMCSGGQLDDRLVEAKTFKETEAAFLMQQIFEAVFYMHDQRICHRDLKPDNILFSRRDAIERSVLKVIDFGSACLFKDGQQMHTKAGSSYYVAPQVLSGKYDKASDLWSCGIIMHILLCGYPPFTGESEEEVTAKVRKGWFEFDKKHWKKVSEDAQMLIRMLIKMNPRERFTAEQALNDAWILNQAPKACSDALDNGTRLRRFQSGRRLKKAALHVIAEQLSESQIRDLENVFSRLDSNGCGLINATQLRTGLKQAGLKKLPSDFDDLIEEVAADSDDGIVIDYKQFVMNTLDKKQSLLEMQETACWDAFSDADVDGDGKITRAEMEELFRSSAIREAMGDRIVADALKKVQRGAARGLVDFEEFMSAFKTSRL
jgi:calcium-dependent protein kinase